MLDQNLRSVLLLFCSRNG